MGAPVESAAASSRRAEVRNGRAESPSIDPWLDELVERGPSRCPKIDCVRTLLHADAIESAERRAKALGIGADRVLIANGRLNEDTYLRALAAELGVMFQPLNDTPRYACPLDDDRLIESAA